MTRSWSYKDPLDEPTDPASSTSAFLLIFCALVSVERVVVVEEKEEERM